MRWLRSMIPCPTPRPNSASSAFCSGCGGSCVNAVSNSLDGPERSKREPLDLVRGGPDSWCSHCLAHDLETMSVWTIWGMNGGEEMSVSAKEVAVACMILLDKTQKPPGRDYLAAM